MRGRSCCPHRRPGTWSRKRASWDRVDAGLPSAALGVFLTAPPLAPAQAQRVRDALARTADGVSLPPPLLIAERVERIDPVPVLTLRTIELAALRVQMWREVASGPERIDIAEWLFAYGSVTIDPASADSELRSAEGVDSVVYVRSRRLRPIAPGGGSRGGTPGELRTRY